MTSIRTLLTTAELAQIEARWRYTNTHEEYRVSVTGSSTPGSVVNALASARTDVPALLATVRHLYAEVTALKIALQGRDLAIDHVVKDAEATAAVNDTLRADLREADKVISDYDDARQAAVKERDLLRDALQRYVETLDGYADDANQSMKDMDAGRGIAYAEASAGLSRLLNGLRP